MACDGSIACGAFISIDSWVALPSGDRLGHVLTIDDLAEDRAPWPDSAPIVSLMSYLNYSERYFITNSANTH